MKIKRCMLLICVSCISLLATGCGELLYTMTAEEESIITLYASKTVSKFNKNQTTGICNARVKAGELEEEYEATVDEENPSEEQPVDEENVQIDPETGEPIEIPDDTESSTSEDGGSDAGLSFTDAVDIEGVTFDCSSFDVATEFKPSQSFVLTEVNGKKYVILYVTATNTTDSAVDFSNYTDREYSLSINGGEKVSTQFTPVSNDLARFDGSLAAGASKDMILVFSFSNSSVEDISSLELYVTSDGTTRGTTI